MADIAVSKLKAHLVHDQQTLTALEGKISNDRIKTAQDEVTAAKLRAQIAELQEAIDTLETGIAYG